MSFFGKKEEPKKNNPVSGKPLKEMTFAERLVENVKSFAWALCVYYITITFVVQNFTIPTGSMEVSLLPGDFIFANKFIYGAKSPENIPFTDIKLPQFQLPAFKEPQQGDVVVFRFPHPEMMPSQNGLDYIKRCVAAPGQTLYVRSKILFVDSVALSVKFDLPGVHFDPYERSEGQVFPRHMGSGDNFGPFRVPKKGDQIELNLTNYELVRYLSLRDGKKLEMRGGEWTVDGVKSTLYTVGQDYFFMMGDNRDNSLDSRYWGPVPRSHIAGQGMLVYWSNTDAAKQSSIPMKVLMMFNFFSVKWHRIGTIIR